MTKTSKRKTTTVKVEGKPIKATPVRRRKASVVEATKAEVPVTEAPVVEAPVAETTPAVETTPVVAEAPKAEAIFAIPDLGKEDLVIGREGFHQLPGKTWHRMSTKFGKKTIRQAIAVMVGIPEIRLPLAIDLAKWELFRPHMVAQLQAVAANKDTLCVLEWVWAHKNWSWKEAYTAFPRVGFPGCKASKKEIGKLNKLLDILDDLKGGETSVYGVDYLAQACHLLGWIK